MSGVEHLSGVLAVELARQKYVILQSALDAARVATLYRYALHLVESCKWQGDTQVADSPALYAEPRMEELLLTLHPVIEKATGLRLYPTYSYLRVYRHGAVLAPHMDRAACEISVSVTLGYEAEAAWPLWIEGPKGVASVRIEPGDALLYRGAECVHWRDAFSGVRAAQALFHYVDQNGPNAEWKFDKRSALGLFSPPAPSAS